MFCLSLFSFAEQYSLCSPPEGRAEYLQKTVSLPSKGSSCTLPRRYKLCEAAAFLWLLTMFWRKAVKVFTQHLLAWYYLLGDQNSSDAFCSWLCLQNTYCFLISTPSGKKGIQVHFSTVNQETALKISVEGVQEKKVNLKGSASCIHHRHTDPGFCRLWLFKELMGARTEQ